jgi:hypothetical protein
MELIALTLAIILAVVVTLKVVSAYTKGKSSEIVTQSMGAIADRARGSRLEYRAELKERFADIDMQKFEDWNDQFDKFFQDKK